MHVLFIPKWYPGPRDPQLGDFIRKQAIALSQQAKVSVLYVSIDRNAPQDQMQQVVEQDGIWELHCRYKGSSVSNAFLRRILNFPAYLRSVRQGIKIFEEERGKPDLLHAHVLVRPAWIAWRLSRRYRVPFIISEHSSEYLDGTFDRKGWLFKGWSRFLFSKAAAVTVVSRWLGDPLVERGLIDRYSILPNVVPGLDRALPAEGDPKHFLIVADLVDRIKNVSGLLRSFAGARRTDKELRLDIIGDGPDRMMLEKLATDLQLPGCVHFHGKLPNHLVLDRISVCGCVIINSNVETFSVVTGEALALGKPVIATRCGGPTAFVTEANGILIAPKDDVALTGAILRIARREFRSTPVQIRNSVSDRYSYTAVGNALMDLYKQVLG